MTLLRTHTESEVNIKFWTVVRIFSHFRRLLNEMALSTSPDYDYIIP